MWATRIREIFIAQHCVDFRKGADGLLAECYHMELDPYQGDCVVFLHRSRRMLKVIGGDEFGVWVLLRRFEGGAMRELFPFLDNPCFVCASQAELAMLLEGATFEVTSKIKPWKKETHKSRNHQSNMLLNANEQKEKRPAKDNSKKGPSKGGFGQVRGVGSQPDSYT